jgi:hypothetical protein
MEEALDLRAHSLPLLTDDEILRAVGPWTVQDLRAG